MSNKNPTPEEKAIMLSHLKGEVTYKDAAKMLGVTDTALAFKIVAYARYAIRKAQPDYGFSEGKTPYPPGSVGAELAKQYKDKIHGERKPLENKTHA